MPYIGKSPVAGGFHKLDSLTASATATYALTLNSAAYYPESANQLLVSLNGVIQAPQDSFTVSGSNIVFDSALTTSDSIDFIVALGDVIGVGSVTDGAITTAKLGNNAVTSAKLDTNIDIAGTLDVTGALTVDSGIYLGGTGSANYLDDYEEGTWTVEMYDALSGGNVSSTTVTGYYTKIGNLVTARFWAFNSVNTSGMTGGNVVHITLPFAASLTGRSVGSCTYDNINLGTGRTQITPRIKESHSRLQLRETGDSISDQGITVDDFTSGASDIDTLSITYAVD